MFENELGSEVASQIKCRTARTESTDHKPWGSAHPGKHCPAHVHIRTAEGGFAGWGCSVCASISQGSLDQPHPARFSKAWLECVGSRKSVNRKLEQAPRGIWSLLTNPLELQENEKNTAILFTFYLKLWGLIFDLFNNTCPFRVPLQAQHTANG